VYSSWVPGSGQKANREDLNSEKSYARWKVHANSVAGNEAMVYDASKRYPNIDVFALNPGFVQTNMRDKIFKRGGFLNRFGFCVTSFMTSTPENYVRRVLSLFFVPELRVRAKITSAFRIPSWSHLCPLLNHKILELALLEHRTA